MHGKNLTRKMVKFFYAKRLVLCEDTSFDAKTLANPFHQPRLLN